MTVVEVQGKKYDVQGILFDKDGTLLEFVSLWGAWATYVFKQLAIHVSNYGILLNTDELPKLLGICHNSEGNVTGYDRRGPLAMGTMNDIQAILTWNLYRHGFPWNDAISVVRHCFSMADVEIERHRTVLAMPGLYSFLKQCLSCKLPLAVVTADDTDQARKHLKWMGIDHHFVEIIGNDQVRYGKPEPEMVHLACSRMRLEPSKLVLIGDTGGDMRMGKRAGVALTIGICPDSAQIHDDLSEAGCIIASYDELTLTCTKEG